jgi:hypothetical protein
VSYFVSKNRNPTALAYVIGGVLSVAMSSIANASMGWPIAWYIFPVSLVLGLLGVFMIESGCEAVVVLILAFIPLAFVLWHYPEYSIGKQIWLTALVGHGSGKLWVGMIR